MALNREALTVVDENRDADGRPAPEDEVLGDRVLARRFLSFLLFAFLRWAREIAGLHPPFWQPPAGTMVARARYQAVI